MSDRYNKLYIALRYYLLGRDYFTALKAFDFARKYHKGTRKDGTTPEFIHQVEIALYVSTLKGLINEERAITLALLHDVEEDYPESSEEINKTFGDSIPLDCSVLNKHKSSNLEMYFKVIATGPETSIVKGADRIHNLNSMRGVFSKQKQQEYSKEVEKYFLPMLKESRNLYPSQTQAFFNVEFMLRSQMNLFKE